MTLTQILHATFPVNMVLLLAQKQMYKDYCLKIKGHAAGVYIVHWSFLSLVKKIKIGPSNVSIYIYIILGFIFCTIGCSLFIFHLTVVTSLHQTRTHYKNVVLILSEDLKS